MHSTKYCDEIRGSFLDSREKRQMKAGNILHPMCGTFIPSSIKRRTLKANTQTLSIVFFGRSPKAAYQTDRQYRCLSDRIASSSPLASDSSCCRRLADAWENHLVRGARVCDVCDFASTPSREAHLDGLNVPAYFNDRNLHNFFCSCKLASPAVFFTAILWLLRSLEIASILWCSFLPSP